MLFYLTTHFEMSFRYICDCCFPISLAVSKVPFDFSFFWKSFQGSENQEGQEANNNISAMEDGLAPSPGASPENPTKEVRFIELIQHRGQMWGIRGVGVGVVVG